MPARSTVVRIGLGILLLTAAGLKLYGLSGSSVPRVGWFAQPWVQLLTAEWEVVLGAWLLSGIFPRLSGLMAIVTFVAFAGVSGYLGWIGVASCGCLGAFKVNPWWTFGVDLTAVSLLALHWPSREDGDFLRCLRAAGVWVGAVALTCGFVVGASSLLFGSLEAALAKLRGDTLAITPAYVDFGTGKPGETLEATATVSNWTDQPVRILGGTSDCTCAAIDDFPLTIPPGEKASFRVRLRIINISSGHLIRTLTVRTDHPSRPEIRFQIGCRVVE